MRVKKQSEKDVLKINIQKTKIMASCPITSRQVKVGKLRTVTDHLFLGSKITTDGNCSHEIKRCLLLGRKTALQTKVHVVKAKAFPVVI